MILGPGGIRSFAHLGVLRELERAEIPIHSIVGYEWGALIGGLYAIKGKSHDTEWKLQKLKTEHVPTKTLFQSKPKKESIGKLVPFLKDPFGRLQIGDLSLKFTCGAHNLVTEKDVWIRGGSVVEALKKCIPYPPIYKSYRGWVANTESLARAVEESKRMGADVIVFVDLLSEGTSTQVASIKENEEAQILWSKVKRDFDANVEGLDWRISVRMGNTDYQDFNSRKRFVLLGQQAGLSFAKQIAKKYGY